MTMPLGTAGLPARPAAIAFDCDGLLVDTEGCWTIAESALFAARGLAFTPADKAVLIGTTIASSVAWMAGKFGVPGHEDELTDELIASVVTVIGEQAKPMPGAAELVALVTGRVPTAVVSNSYRQLVDLALARAGLAGAFDVVVPIDAVAHGKPAPDLYLHACELLGVRPAEAVAVEDSLVGVRSAKAAGLTVIGIPTVVQDGFAPDVRFGSLDDPSLLAWARAL